MKYKISGWFRIYGVLLFLFFLIDPFFPVETANRTLPLILQSLLVGFGILYMIGYILQKYSNPFGKFLAYFVLYLGVYAAFSPYFFSTYPLILMATTSFFVFYRQARKAEIDLRVYLKYFIILFLFGVYWMLGVKDTIASEYGNEFEIADNRGYFMMMLSLFFLLDLKSKRNIILFFLSSLMVFFSMKKGAILCSALIILVVSYDQIFRNKALHNGQRLLLFALLIGIVVASASFFDNIIDRFERIEQSGRDVIYTTVFNGWTSGTLMQQLFGQGFFSCTKILSGGAYAHSDWFEILYDEGILGVILYLILFVIYLYRFKSIKYYAPNYKVIYLSFFIIWCIKSSVSGMIVVKDSILLFALIGFVMGTADKNKLINRVS